MRSGSEILLESTNWEHENDFLDLKKLIYELNSAGKLNWEIINSDDY